MKKNTKRVFWGFFSLDYKVIEVYLEEMAKKGWMLEKVGTMTAKFRAIEPKNLKFYVDVFKEGGPFTPENTKEAEEYRGLCQESGWNFITSHDYLQFFYAREDKTPVPIQTDEALEQKIVESTLWRGELVSMLLFSVIAVIALTRLFPIGYNNFLTFTGVVGTLLFPILCAIMLGLAAYGFIRTLRAKKNVERGIPLEKPTLKGARRRILAFHCTVYIIAVIFIMAFIFDSFFKPRIVTISLLGPIVGLSFGYILRYIIKKKIKDKKDSAGYAAFTIVFVIFSLMIVNSMIINRSVTSIYREDTIPEGYPIVTALEISETLQQGSLVFREFNYGMSPIIPKHYDYWEVRDLNGKSEGIRIKYYEAIHPYFAEALFNSITEKLRKGIKYRGMTMFTKNVITDDEMRTFWNADNFALTEDRKEIIIQKEGIVLHFSGNIDFGDRQTRDLIINRFFTD